MPWAMDDGFIEVLFLPCFIIFNLYGLYTHTISSYLLLYFYLLFIVVVWYDDLQQMIENQA